MRREGALLKEADRSVMKEALSQEVEAFSLQYNSLWVRAVSE